MISKNWWVAVISAQFLHRPSGPTTIFVPPLTPAVSTFALSIPALAITAAIFLVFLCLLTRCLVKFTGRRQDDSREPTQVGGSNQVELVWTVVPLLIILVLLHDQRPREELEA